MEYPSSAKKITAMVTGSQENPFNEGSQMVFWTINDLGPAFHYKLWILIFKFTSKLATPTSDND